jgi:hypothetical protein
MIIDLSRLVDARNRSLWETLNATLNINVEASNNNEYSCFNINKDSTIYVVPHDLCPDSFTHELLHLYLRLKQVYIGAGFTNMVQSSNTLTKIFSEPLLDHIGNCLDHMKMFQLYEDLGFSPDKFIMDFHEFKCKPTELAHLKRNYSQRSTYYTEAVDFFIGKYIAIQADFNDEFDYDYCLAELKKLDPVLYSSLERFIFAWEEFDIESEDIIANSYHFILNDLYEDLKKWLSKKVFV